MKTIKLSNKVIVTDPCYKTDVFCLFTTDNAKPGDYSVKVSYSNDTSWGRRVAEITAEHVDYQNRYLSWELASDEIGVDSGQCGIFDFEEYRDDKASESFGLPLSFGKNWNTENGDYWYQRICSLTLSKKDGGVSDDQWGIIPTGVVSSSGYGDGAYHLYVKTDDEKIVAFSIVYLNI